MQPRIGLVFAGGGGKGAYQLGVWKALEEIGIAQRVEAVAGTSVGALNAALFSQGDYGLAESTWLGITAADVLHITTDKLLKLTAKIGVSALTHRWGSTWAYLHRSGIFSREGLTRVIDKALRTHLPQGRRIVLYANCSRLCVPLFRRQYFALHGRELAYVRQVLLASSAIPGVFGKEEIDGASYYDGFFTDNSPVRAVYEHGCRLIIVAFLSRDDWINPSDYPGATFIPIMPREDPGGLFTGVLNFSRMSEKIERGYQDTWRILKPLARRVAVQHRWGELLGRFAAQQQEFEQYLAHSAALAEERDGLQQQVWDQLARW